MQHYTIVEFYFLLWILMYVVYITSIDGPAEVVKYTKERQYTNNQLSPTWNYNRYYIKSQYHQIINIHQNGSTLEAILWIDIMSTLNINNLSIFIKMELHLKLFYEYINSHCQQIYNFHQNGSTLKAILWKTRLSSSQHQQSPSK